MPLDAVNAGIELSSTYVSAGVPEAGVAMYARYDAPTWHPFEEALGALEQAALPALVFGSGMAAVDAAFSLVPPGGRIVLPRHTYQVTLGLAAELERRIGLAVELVDIADTDAVVAALPGAAMLWVESPTNPMLEVADLPALCAAARAAGVLVVVDNTFATPLGQTPLTLGADLVMHSATKLIGGHSDLVLGAIVAADPAFQRRLLDRRHNTGSIPGVLEAYLALRGLRTLPTRLERAQATARELAARLAADPDTPPRVPGNRDRHRCENSFES